MENEVQHELPDNARIEQTPYGTLLILLHWLDMCGISRTYLVGGCVRDAVMNRKDGVLDFKHESIKDFDVEVFGYTLEQVGSALSQARGTKIDYVGQSFGVLKVTFMGHTFDFSTPRRERKVADGYRGFDIEFDPHMTVQEAGLRRDLTINALYYDVLAGTLIDNFGGEMDIQCGILKATSDRFDEDPLRVLRVFQFAARFGFRPDSALTDKCRALLLEKGSLSKERVWGEWEKWCLKSVKPGSGLVALSNFGFGWVEEELDFLQGVLQDSTWHPEGDVYKHTLHVVDVAAEIRDREALDRDRGIILMLAALCHDFGKDTTTIFDEGRWKAPGHAEAGVAPAATFLYKIGCPVKYLQPVLTLVKEHMAHTNGISMRACKRLVNRLVEGGTDLYMLSLLVEADASGRPPLPKGMPKGMIELLELAKAGNIDGSKKIPPFIQGRDLIELGVEPGPRMGIILDRIYQGQLDGEVVDKAQALALAIQLIRHD